MQTVSQNEMLARLRSLLPRGWFPDVSPTLDALLFASAINLSHVYNLLSYARDQGRLATASDGWLDLLAYDFLGLRVRRAISQTDNAFRALVKREILRTRVTREGIRAAVYDLTGNEVRIFEPWNTGDTGGLDTGYLGFDMIGRFGSVDMPFCFFLATLQPVGAGIPDVGGLDNGLGGFDTNPGELGDLSQVQGAVTDQDIYDTINATRAAGVTAWVAIGLPPEAHLDDDFILDVSELVGP